jgi:hypothetical protein
MHKPAPNLHQNARGKTKVSLNYKDISVYYPLTHPALLLIVPAICLPLAEGIVFRDGQNRHNPAHKRHSLFIAGGRDGVFSANPSALVKSRLASSVSTPP